MSTKKKYTKGGPKASDYVGNPMGYFNDRAEFKMQEGGEFEPYLSENKTIYHTGPNSGIMRSKGFRNLKHAQRRKKKMDKTELQPKLRIIDEKGNYEGKK